jgi:hypothetical protein
MILLSYETGWKKVNVLGSRKRLIVPHRRNTGEKQKKA